MDFLRRRKDPSGFGGCWGRVAFGLVQNVFGFLEEMLEVLTEVLIDAGGDADVLEVVIHELEEACTAVLFGKGDDVLEEGTEVFMGMAMPSRISSSSGFSWMLVRAIATSMDA